MSIREKEDESSVLAANQINLSQGTDLFMCVLNFITGNGVRNICQSHNESSRTSAHEDGMTWYVHWQRVQNPQVAQVINFAQVNKPDATFNVAFGKSVSAVSNLE